MSAHRDSPDDRFSRPLRQALERQARTPAGNCPDTSTLAAYYDGALTGDERHGWESHFSACARCQQQLAAMVKGDPARLNGSPEAAPRGLLARWRWLVPITAAGTALATWLIVADVDPTRTNAPTMSQRAMDEAVAPRAADGQEAAEKLGTPAPAGQQAGEVSTFGQPAAPPDENRGAELSAPNAANVRAPAAADSVDRDAAESAPGRANMDPAPPALEEKAEVADDRLRRDESAERQRELPAAPPPAAPAEGEAITRSASTPASEAMAARTEASGVAGGVGGGVAGPLAQRSVTVFVVSPDPAIRWQIGPAGRILRSEDAGASWSPQVSGVTVDLLAGSCPSPRVCWVVGSAGTVLRTTDGVRWEPAAAATPEADPLVDVRASSADEAIVRTQAGVRFRTTDGGRSWQAVR